MNPLSQELQQLLGLVTYQHADTEVPAPLAMLEPTIKERHAPVLEDSWDTDGSCQGQTSTWKGVVYQPSTDSIWMENGSGQRSNGLS